jgi:hypothetical protein
VPKSMLFEIDAAAAENKWLHMFNLSSLPSDIWAVAVRALGFHESMDSIYFVAFGLACLPNVDEEQQADGSTMCIKIPANL